MSEHRVAIAWRRGGADFSYEAYPRDHTWTFEGGVEVPASAAPEYRGNPQRVDPEAAFVAALASCHMLTFLAIAARRKLVVESYSDAAVGTLEKNAEGRLAVTHVVLRPEVVFASASAPDAQEVRRLHERAHEGCFIANSVRTEVSVEPAPGRSGR
jgi:organic hydroperoxide reductase OsmC/OhrA